MTSTHVDERSADLPLSELREAYPQIIDQWEVSNKTGRGVDALRSSIASVASGLPLMGEYWPARWLDAANTIRSSPRKYVGPQEFWNLMAEHGVSDLSAIVLARWLHELGDILHFADNEDLNDVVVLKPQWVSQYISMVLESEEVVRLNGVFTRDHMNVLWRDLDPAIRDHFLRLMEGFDLSYR